MSGIMLSLLGGKPAVGFTVEYLVIAGGGSGGRGSTSDFGSGGGGAGGFRTAPIQL